MPWRELLGEPPGQPPAYLARKRWEQWKSLCRQGGNDCDKKWTNPVACGDCRFLSGDWCRRRELPTTFNPVLTERDGPPGMACLGAGYEPADATDARR